MFTRTSFIALAAVATLAAVALAPVSAFAKPGGFGGGNKGPAFNGGNKPVMAKPVALKPVNNPNKPIDPGFNKKKHHHDKVIIVTTPVVQPVVQPVMQAAARPSGAAKPLPGPCTCLTKEYLPDRTVVFKDVCTKESASSAPGTQAQLASPGVSNAQVQGNEAAQTADQGDAVPVQAQ